MAWAKRGCQPEDTESGSTQWKHRVEAPSGSTEWKHRVEAPSGSTEWKHPVEAPSGSSTNREVPGRGCPSQRTWTV
ncbi:hypothetical protein RRG08_039889 [Elysia crispata]|uniref:Uncharacterized protein n=1 Tax=Elysia crispata TaxID=231223 RepID=A0AAE0ZWH7_9GAST|nr:hypothetical protein RRG08_039889 [Elysia crispata]